MRRLISLVSLAFTLTNLSINLLHSFVIASICVLVGEDEEVSIKQVADSIVKAIGFAGEYSFDTSRADGQFRKPASNKKLISAMGGFEFTAFEQGTFIDR